MNTENLDVSALTSALNRLVEANGRDVKPIEWEIIKNILS